VARLPAADVPARFGAYLAEVYAAARRGAVSLDGQNVFVYRGGGGRDGETEVAFGVGVSAPFAPVGPVRAVPLPVGPVAATTHWGDYAGLGAAHAAVVAWCEADGHAVAGTRWEIYGHWSADPAARRTDVYYLLATPDGSR
jgi:effector-binding domain-containing protein